MNHVVPTVNLPERSTGKHGKTLHLNQLSFVFRVFLYCTAGCNCNSFSIIFRNPQTQIQTCVSAMFERHRLYIHTFLTPTWKDMWAWCGVTDFLTHNSPVKCFETEKKSLTENNIIHLWHYLLQYTVQRAKYCVRHVPHISFLSV